AAHLCYLAASNDCLQPADRVMLVGGDHINTPKGGFVTSLSIERTEAFLFAQSLNSSEVGTPRFLQAINEFLPFRLVESMFLAEQGQIQLAQEWLNSIDSLISQGA